MAAAMTRLCFLLVLFFVLYNRIHTIFLLHIVGVMQSLTLRAELEMRLQMTELDVWERVCLCTSLVTKATAHSRIRHNCVFVIFYLISRYVRPEGPWQRRAFTNRPPVPDRHGRSQ